MASRRRGLSAAVMGPQEPRSGEWRGPPTDRLMRPSFAQASRGRCCATCAHSSQRGNGGCSTIEQTANTAAASEMAGSLKQGNRLALLGVAAGNLAIFYGAVRFDTLLASNWILGGDWTGWRTAVEELGSLVPAGLGLALVGIINAQLSAEAKARIVFLRWNDALPGCEAFSHHAHTDSRVDLAVLDRLWGPLPTEEDVRNSVETNGSPEPLVYAARAWAAGVGGFRFSSAARSLGRSR